MRRAVKLKYCLTTSDSGTWGDDANGAHDVPVLRSTEIGLDGSINAREPALRSLNLRERTRTRLRKGDILVVRSSGSDLHLGKAGYVEESAAGLSFSNFLQRLRFTSAYDSRFAWHFLNCTDAKQQIRKLSSTTTGLQNLSAGLISELEIPSPPLQEQRRIAEFLDTETARMDRLTSQLQRFDHDVRERESAILASLLNADSHSTDSSLPGGWSWVPLRHLTDPLRQIMYGIVLPGPDVAEGVPIVKGGDVAANRLSLKTLNRTTHEIEAGYARSRLKGGDLVIAIRGSVGEIAVVPDELTGANLTQDAARISIGEITNADWLRLVLQSPAVKAQVQQRITGATIKGINIWDLKRISVPTPNPSDQQKLAQEAGKALATHEALRSRVERHQALLGERRQALITAAVTGQFDVTTASGRNVTAGVTA
ncbi:restriction endonuclease subunit S [Streptomyces sp. NPDC059454]|uniref:restriction endonuclease subunit S n=1 Tax=Streptomyces sp. NPDC059454 TaxID=3346836 RepID=UPI003674EBB3